MLPSATCTLYIFQQEEKLDQIQLVHFFQHKTTTSNLDLSESTPLPAFYADMLYSTLAVLSIADGTFIGAIASKW